jgi:hypothetical protein
MTSMPSNPKMIRSVSIVLLPNSKGTPLVTNSEEMFPPAVLIVNASLVLQEFSSTLLSIFPFMKLCVAPESNNTWIGLPRIENAHHYWFSFWNITHRSETKSALPGLSNLLLALVEGFGNLSLIRPS